jgi:NAD(P)-dependent dehydrogenase (short-subunit alcohol dehydrogenase family)
MKTCLVTGSSGLIGSEISKEFLRNGYGVIGFDRKPNKDLNHPNFQFFKVDLTQEKEILAAYTKLVGLDVLINCAAKANPIQKRFHLLKLSEWRDLLAIDLDSYFLMTKHALPLLQKSQGSIINISSTRHIQSEANTEAYTAGKGAIDALTRALAISYGPEVRVNSISPGWINDPSEKLKKKDHEQHPAGRVGIPSDIAKMAYYLASDGAEFITGADFVIDGGMTAKMIYAK